MTPSGRSHIRRRRRLLVIPVVAAMIATSCGGGDDDAADADESAEVSGAEPTVTEAPAEETVSEEPAAVPETSDEDTEDGSPVVETLPPETIPDPVQGGTLRYGLEADVDGLNPTESALSAPGLMMTNAVFDSLAAVTPDGTVVPNLAESFTPSADFKNWTMKLRARRHLPRRRAAQRRRHHHQLRGPTERPAGRPGGQAVLPGDRRHHQGRRPHGRVQPARRQRLLPGHRRRSARHARLAEVARGGGRRPHPQPAAGRHRARSSSTAAARTRSPGSFATTTGGAARSTSTPSSSTRSPTRPPAST